MKKIGIFYGSSGGTTKRVAEEIGDLFNKKGCEVSIFDVGNSKTDDFENFDFLIFGVSTWGEGELQEDWQLLYKKLDNIDFSNKKIALFGTGDQEMYPDTFVDALGLLHNKVKSLGAEIVGNFIDDDLIFDNSLAFDGEKFVGLVIDEDNQAEKTPDRIHRWVNSLINEFNL